jgi:hypothetical protein
VSTAIATSPHQSRALIVADTLTQESEQRVLLGKFVREQMVPDTDFGIIPGTKKNTLLKPGAEKLVNLFHCLPKYTEEKVIEDWDKPLFYYKFKCQILLNEEVVAEGFGSANSREAKWRWRSQNRACPNCGKETIIKGKAEWGGGWLCHTKQGGCGAKFGDDAPEIIGQAVGRVENPDVYDQVNTILKIAKKRALVDAAIALARCSDIFTQDVEDAEEPAKPAPAQPAKAAPTKPTEAAKASPGGKLSKAEFAALQERKGKDWKFALKFIDHNYKTTHVKAQSSYDAVEPDYLAEYVKWLNEECPDGPAKPIPPAAEGKTNADPTPAPATAPTTTATAPSTVPAAATPPATATSSAAATAPSSTPTTTGGDPPRIGAEVHSRIMAGLHEVDLYWEDVRKDVVDAELRPTTATQARSGILAAIGLSNPPERMRANELTPEQGLALDKILRVRLAKKKERQAQRAASKGEEVPA